jgi:hypothetical protein
MQAFLNSLLALFANLASLITFNGMFVLGIILTIPMTVIFVAEIFNYQFVLRAPFFVKVERRWNVKAVAVVAMTAALSVILQAVGAVIVLVPGTITFRADALIRFPFGAIFGMPAVWGVMISNIIGDALAGTLGPGSIAGFIISWYMAYLFYRFYNGYKDYSMIKGNAWWKYYLTTLLWCFLGAFYLCTNFQLLNLLPQEVIWPGVFPAVIVTTFIGGLLGPIVARVIGPAAKRYGLSRDEMGYEKDAVVPLVKPLGEIAHQKV